MPELETILHATCVAGHIDHGKTTLLDHFLTIARSIPPKMAGELRALDYWAQEQERGITLKSANAILTVIEGNVKHVINLIDTPGHVDLSMIVSNSLRLSDVVILVVDVVEGIMAQTETIIEQINEENLDVILFINKIDRYINELELGPEKLKEQVEYIISTVDGFLPHVDLSFATNRVVIGSAKQGWGINNALLKEHPITMSEIYELVSSRKLEELKKNYFVAKVLLNSIISVTKDSCFYSSQKLAKMLESDTHGESIEKMKDEVLLLVGSGTLISSSKTYFQARVLNGTLKQGSILFSSDGRKIKISQLFKSHINRFLPVKEARCGDIIFLSTNVPLPLNTILSSKSLNLKIKSLEYPVTPVISYAILPERGVKYSQLIDALKRIKTIDPLMSFEFNDETGELILHVVGEIHKDVINDLMKKYFNLSMKFSVPFIEEIEELDEPCETRISNMDKTFILELTCDNLNRTNAISPRYTLIYSVRDNALLVPRDLNLPLEIIDGMKFGFKIAVESGPLGGKKIKNLATYLKKVIWKGDVSLLYDDAVIYTKRAIHECLKNGLASMKVPFYDFEVKVRKEYLGKALNILNQHNAKIKSMSENTNVKIEGVIKVRQSLGLPKNILNETSGYAFWNIKRSYYASSD